MRALLLGDRPEPLAGDLEAILAAWRGSGLALWLDLAPEPGALERLRTELSLHPLAVAECIGHDHRPKAKDYADHIFLVLSTLPDPEAAPHPRDRRRLATRELDCFIGAGYLLTMHRDPVPAVERVWEQYHRDDATPTGGAGPELPLYSIGEEVLSGYFGYLDQLDEEMDRAERMIFGRDRPGRRHLPPMDRIFDLKRRLQAVRRALAPTRDALGALARRDLPHLSPQSHGLMADLHDQSLRLMELIESMRDLLAGLVDAHLTVQGNRMNEIMKTLTVIATVMIPLTVITGFFGMNFVGVPALFTPTAFWLALGGMAAVAAGMMIYFRSSGWF